MVKIDGDKVKHLREHKGLTQLYVATVVQVTTDTISRWENKRYPTIKKENAVRLAEALECDIESILMQEESEPPTPEISHPRSQTGPAPDSHVNIRPRIVPLIVLLLFICTASIASYIYLHRPPPLIIESRRYLPKQCTLGQPFPVAIEVKVTNQTEPISVIVKEDLPAGITVINTSPAVPSALPQTGTLKWLDKVEGRAIFTYIATLSSPGQQVVTGSISTGNGGGTTLHIGGPSELHPSEFHWADSNGDNMISDQEILTVYDQYGDVEDLGLDVDLIEEIWLGSGYRYNKETHTYTILP